MSDARGESHTDFIPIAARIDDDDRIVHFFSRDRSLELRARHRRVVSVTETLVECRHTEIREIGREDLVMSEDYSLISLTSL